MPAIPTRCPVPLHARHGTLPVERLNGESYVLHTHDSQGFSLSVERSAPERLSRLPDASTHHTPVPPQSWHVASLQPLPEHSRHVASSLNTSHFTIISSPTGMSLDDLPTGAKLLGSMTLVYGLPRFTILRKRPVIVRYLPAGTPDWSAAAFIGNSCIS